MPQMDKEMLSIPFFKDSGCLMSRIPLLPSLSFLCVHCTPVTASSFPARSSARLKDLLPSMLPEHLLEWFAEAIHCNYRAPKKVLVRGWENAAGKLRQKRCKQQQEQN